MALSYERGTPVTLVFLCMAAVASAALIEVTGSLVDASNQPLSGNVSVFQEIPGISEISVGHYEVTANGTFAISADSEGGLVLHAWAEGYASVEHIVEPGASGKLVISITLPQGQDVSGRVVDGYGNGV